jgi:hypothetical protein
VEALADAIGLWAAGLGACVVDVLHREIKLTVVSRERRSSCASIG